MTDTIDERLAKLQAKLKAKPTKFEKPAFHEKIQKTKKTHCSKCNQRFRTERDKFLINRKLICGYCHDKIIDRDS